jgi:predicted dehydrogenase/nucleoside-diphosphate-sugar epimerase
MSSDGREKGMTEKLRVGIIGCGKMGMQHLRAVKQARFAELVGVSDPVVDARDLEPILPSGVPVFSEAAELLRTARPDVVHVVTPPSTHAELARLALDHGSHVFVEKPFTLDRRQAEEIAALAAGKGLRVCAGHQLLFEKATLSADALLPAIGRVVHIESYFSFRPVRKSRAGGGKVSPLDQLIDILPHPVYVLLHFLRPADPAEGPGRLEVRSVEADPRGNVVAVVRQGDRTGMLVVTLNGRPVESYLRVVGTNGSLHVDYVHGSVTKLLGPGSSAVSILLNPYSASRQIATGAARGFYHLVASRKKGVYPGLQELVDAFYAAILGEAPPPFPDAAIVDTVGICEAVGTALRRNEEKAESVSEAALRSSEATLGPPAPGTGGVLVTGGTGFLGRRVVSELRTSGWPVRALSRAVPPFSEREPGVEYLEADLADPVPARLLDGISVVVHCAAETAGNKQAHERNSILATRNLLDAAAAAGVRKFLHISSIAVLKPSREVKGPVDENTPLDLEESRGPYVWGKAESERLVRERAEKLGVTASVLRLGPLVDFDDYAPPGRLGRELGSRFVCMGKRGEKLSVCDVGTAAAVIRRYVERFEESPRTLNLVEPEPLTRKELFEKFRAVRPDLKPLYVPGILIRSLSPILKGLQKIAFPGKKPIDIHAAFSAEVYRTDLAKQVTAAIEAGKRRSAEPQPAGKP